MGCGASSHSVKSTFQDPEHKINMKLRPSFSLKADIHWLDPQFHDTDQTKIRKPNEMESNLMHPPKPIDEKLFDRILGSLMALALGDALGAHVEFRPHHYLLENPVTDFQEGGTWGLKKGQFTDDTSMALCLAISLIVCGDFSPYDQLVRYKWWYRHGYMSSTGECFDIGAATSQSLREFERHQNMFADKKKIPREEMDLLSDPVVLTDFNVYCSHKEAAGNGGLMRLSPVPLFCHRDPIRAVENSGVSAEITHGDRRVYDACRFYGALIVAAMRGETKAQLLDPNFYKTHKPWFGSKPLHDDVQKIVDGSYMKEKGYNDGIRGKGFVLNSLEAALWAFWSDKDSFEIGALSAVNLGDDTDTTAAIYGQLAGACYGFKNLPKKWVQQVYAKTFITCLSEWITYEGQKWSQKNQSTGINSHSSSQNHSDTSPLVSSSKKHVENKSSSKEKVPNKSRNQVSGPKRSTNK